MRVSELAGLNLKDVNGETVRVLGKGNKERILYLNPACQQAIQDYLSVRDETNVTPKIRMPSSFHATIGGSV